MTRIEVTSSSNTILRTALEEGEGTLDNGPISHDNLFDTFRLSLMFWH